MLGNAVPSLLQHVRRLAATASSDEQLLADFLARRSDEAFAALVGRHGPMVLNVCRRALHDAHAAEDVFQATFLVLADRAGAIRRRASLAGFLHGVAYRLAVRARRRRTQGLPAALCDKAVGPTEGLAWKEMLGILDHELGQLSDRYRAPLVLCYLEGRTQDEAARQLGWGLSTLRRRLAQGRRLLEARLRGRGVTLSAVLAGLLAASAAAVPADLRAATLAAAGARAVGGLTAGASALTSARKGIALLLSTAGKKIGAVVAVAVLGAAVCLAYCWAPHADQAPAAGAGRGDPADDPLPTGAAVRLGTARYRHGTRIESFAVSADGRLAAAASGWRSLSPARVFDLTDGRCLYSLPYEVGSSIEAVGLSPDGKTLATKDDTFLYFRDAATGKELRKIKYLPASGGSRAVTDWLTFTPDGQQLAATLMGDAVHLIDVGTGEVTRTFEHGWATSACAFSPDGKRMATAGYEREKGVYCARLWEIGTGKELRRFPAGNDLGGNGRKRVLAFSPDGTMLAGGGWGDARLRLWETATGKELQVFPKMGRDIEGVAFSPDGKTVAAAGDNVYLYDPATGKERLRIGRRAQRLAFSRDGAALTGAVSGAIYRWDAASGRQLTPAAAQDSAVEQILVSADGRSLFTTDQDGDLRIWDTAGGKSPRRIAGGVDREVVASSDRRSLAWTVRDVYGNSRIRLYDVAADRIIDPVLRSSAGFRVIGGEATVAAFLPDGKSLLTLEGGPATFRLWDLESWKERRSFTVVPPKSVGDPGLATAALPFCTPRRAALSPDGKTLAVGPDFPEGFRTEDGGVPVRLWDVETGRAGRELQKPMKLVDGPGGAGAGTTRRLGMGPHWQTKSMDGRAFSSDGRFLADWAEHPFGRSRIDHVYVWDAVTGRAVATLAAGPRNGAANAAFAPDGRTLATASADGTIRLWEMATWTVRAEFRGHRDRVTALAFGPDGRLFTGGLDTVVLGWDVRPPRGPAKGPLAEAWEALAKPDARTAFQAQGRFLAGPAKAVEWFAARLTPASSPGPARVKALIADLDNADFATRERTTADLKEHAAVAAAALRAVLAKSPSAEARRRAAGLLREVEKGVIPPRELRALRAVEVLEWVATPEARARLLELTKGAPGARLTRAAAAACERLEGRK
ncbi:MAG TPA: sigma-70 family RNA polymerase sigma factor [Gemmataceae bacterium]|nr:sigma-70 family RNA polymerase sigma factor [Gemmataceae bacterium]